MPIYEYRCGNCGYEMEAIQKISEAPLVDCPRCETAQLRKKISRVAFRLKGSGWYETDFKSGQQRNLAGADNGSGKDRRSVRLWRGRERGQQGRQEQRQVD